MTCTLVCFVRGLFTSPLTAILAASTLEFFSLSRLSPIRRWVVARLSRDVGGPGALLLARVGQKSGLRGLRCRRRNT